MNDTAGWVAIADSDELGTDQMKTIALGDRRLLLVNAGGTLHLIDEMCTHEDYSLALGCIKDGKIKCSLHGSYFDLQSGAALDEPASEPLTVHPLRTQDGRVWTKIA